MTGGLVAPDGTSVDRTSEEYVESQGGADSIGGELRETIAENVELAETVAGVSPTATGTSASDSSGSGGMTDGSESGGMDRRALAAGAGVAALALLGGD